MKKIKIKNLSPGCLLFVFILGLVAGCLVFVVLPRVAHLYPFDKIPWLVNQKDGVTIINKTEKIIVTENEALEEIISQVSQTVVGVKIIGAKNVVLSEGSGFILTGDGLLLTAASVITPGQKNIIIIRNGVELPAKIEQYRPQDNLAILKIEETNLPVVRLADTSGLRLGQAVFLLAVNIQKKPPEKFVNAGLVSSISLDGFDIDIDKERPLANGSPLFNVKGEVIGLNLVDSSGNLSIIKAEKVKELLR